MQLGKKQVCETIASTVQPGDEYGVIRVTAEPPLFENLQETNPSQVRRDCKRIQPAVVTKLGTRTCEAWEIAKRQVEASGKPPIVLVQIQSDEREKPCPEIWRETAKAVIQRGGQVLILNSTNQGNESFHSELRSALDGLSPQKIKFYTNLGQAVKTTIQSIRETKKMR